MDKAYRAVGVFLILAVWCAYLYTALSILSGIESSLAQWIVCAMLALVAYAISAILAAGTGLLDWFE